MDVAKYIGLFLLKNQFCYVHGLGNLEVRRKPATYNGDMLQPAQYEVALTPGGSIDDNLANFIATNEQISISKAANALRDFSTQAKADLHAGKEVIIPAIGKFTENEGRLFFITDPNLQFAPPSMPAMRVSRRLEKLEQPEFNPPAFQNQQQQGYKAPVLSQPDGGRVNWGRVVLAVGVLAAIVAGVFFGYRYVKNRNLFVQKTPPIPAIVPSYKDTVVQQPKPIVTDTTIKAKMASGDTLHYLVEIDGYDNKSRAEKRVKQMKGYGHNVNMMQEDSNTFLIVMPVATTSRDTTKVLDSLSRLFNPSGVTVYVKK